jgi:hypothetical protein
MLYPLIFAEGLDAQLSDTLCGAALAGVDEKLTFVTDAPLMTTAAVAGKKLYPAWAGVSTYDPFARPANAKLPSLPVVTDCDEDPDRTTVAPDPVRVPEMVEVAEGIGVAPRENTGSTQ